MAQLIPFRSTKKLEYLHDKTPTINTAEVQQIPKYKRQRQYEIRHVHGMKTWMMDFIFLKRDNSVLQAEEHENAIRGNTRNLLTVLLLLHCNSRYCIAQIVPSRSEQYVQPLILMLFQDDRIDTLITDSEKSFRTRSLTRLFGDGKIKHIVYNMKALEQQNVMFAHRYLALIDRMSRTLRDMIFNCKRNNPAFTLTQTALQSILQIYNDTPHSTLTAIMKFPVSPQQMIDYPVLHQEFIRRVMSMNTLTMARSKTVNVGDEVYLHQPRALGLKRRNNVEDDTYVITEKLPGGQYRLQNTRDKSIVKLARRGDFILT